MKFVHKIDKEQFESLKMMLSTEDGIPVAMGIITNSDLSDDETYDHVEKLIHDDPKLNIYPNFTFDKEKFKTLSAKEITKLRFFTPIYS